MSSFYTGSVLDGRFELVSSLGEGAAGEVWIARDLRLGIQVAVKILHASLRADSDQLRAFEREAELCARMLSPHIVRVIAYGVAESEAPFIAYELLEGETLDARILREKKLGLDDTEAVVVQVGRGLARAHSMGIVHKDVKPGNVFLTKDERGRDLLKVLDFGIAEVVHRPTAKAGEISGTLEYMPIEVLRDGQAAETRTDLFALTVLTYEALTGEVPFPAETPAEMIRAMKKIPATVAPAIAEPGAAPIDAWMQKGLAVSAENRFQTARELAESFHAAVKEAKQLLGIVPPPSRRSVQMNAPKIATPLAFTPSPLVTERTPTNVPDSRRAIPPSATPMRPRAPSFVFEDDIAEQVVPSKRDGRRE